MLVFDTLKWGKGCVMLALSTSNGLGELGSLVLPGSVCDNH